MLIFRRISQALEREAVPEALAKATSVLAGVKARGLAAGDVMDAQTEHMLWPQIVNEALARSVVALVRRQHRRQHRVHSLDPRNLALPPAKSSSSDGSTSEGGIGSKDAKGADSVAVAPPWEFEQLEKSTAAHLSSNQGFACVDDFLGADWPDLVLADVLRLCMRSAVVALMLHRQGQVLWHRKPLPLVALLLEAEVAVVADHSALVVAAKRHVAT